MKTEQLLPAFNFPAFFGKLKGEVRTRSTEPWKPLSTIVPSVKEARLALSPRPDGSEEGGDGTEEPSLQTPPTAQVDADEPKTGDYIDLIFKVKLCG